MKPLVFAIGLTALITVLLVLPGTAFPERNWLSDLWIDKWVHIGLFAMLAFTWLLSIPDNRKQWFTVLSLCFLYGCGMELIQHFFIPYRSFDWLDIMADGVGLLAGSWALKKWRTSRYIKK